jgi:TusA-related sulfurtransferase
MNQDPLIQPDESLDCTGLYCPQPIIRTAERAKEMQAGQVLEIRATDPGFQIDLPAWCVSHRHAFLGIHQQGRSFVGYVRLEEAT